MPERRQRQKESLAKLEIGEEDIECFCQKLDREPGNLSNKEKRLQSEALDVKVFST